MAEKKTKRKHLHKIVSESTGDGHIVHHHTYKKSRDDEDTEPERRNVAVSSSPEEAGQHVAEQMGMNDQSPQDPGAAQPEADPSQGAAPASDPSGGMAGM